MPAETHRAGRPPGSEEVLELLDGLLGDEAGSEDGSVTLGDAGVEAASLGDLWHAVCEEFAERTLGPELESGVLDPSMTLQEAATTMAMLLQEAPDDAD